jgi:Glyoxalase-like domain
MACKFSEFVIDSAQPKRIARWWAHVLDYRITEEDEEQVEIAGPPGSGPTLVFVRVPERKSVKNRLHMDLSATDRDQAEELERLQGLGAEPADVGQGEDAPWVVLRDPDGNEFCLLGWRREPWVGAEASAS